MYFLKPNKQHLMIYEKIARSIKSVTGQINMAERRRANLTQEQLDLLNRRKAYKKVSWIIKMLFILILNKDEK